MHWIHNKGTWSQVWTNAGDDDGSHKHGDSIDHKSTNIIQLDKSYLTHLKKSDRENKMKHDNAEKHQVKEEMMRQLEDLTERLCCCERTIASLDHLLKQMRASRFK